MISWNINFCSSSSFFKGVNAIEFLSACMQYLQRQFYERFPPHEFEPRYGFECSSSFKPIRISSPNGALNQIPYEATFEVGYL